ncbi:MAG: hypothetical protein V1702_05670 [Candidatus Woesearchaeota archaeon]
MKAQASIEYLMVLGILMIIILPTAYFFYQYSDSSADQIASAQIETFGRAIVINAARVYYMGAPARMTVSGRLPDNVISINISTDWKSNTNQIVFVTKSRDGKISEQAYSSKVNINGTFVPNDFTGGVKNFLLEAYKASDGTPFVFINAGERCPISTFYDWRGDGEPPCYEDTVWSMTCGTALNMQKRTSGVWNDKWNTCIKMDYNGDCISDNADLGILWGKCRENTNCEAGNKCT